MKVFACLWNGRDLPSFSAGRYAAGDVEKMRDNLAATNPKAKLHIIADGEMYGTIVDLPGIVPHFMKGIGCGGWTNIFEAFIPDLWPAPGERHVQVGLDTVFMRECSWLWRWDKAPVGLPLDPYHYPEPCNAVTVFDKNGAAIVYRAFMEERARNGMSDYQMFDRASEMVLLRHLYRIHGWAPLEQDPKRLLSWKVHVRDGKMKAERADVVYFHGKEKPNSLPDSDPVKRAWLSTPQPT